MNNLCINGNAGKVQKRGCVNGCNIPHYSTFAMVLYALLNKPVTLHQVSSLTTMHLSQTFDEYFGKIDSLPV